MPKLNQNDRLKAAYDVVCHLDGAGYDIYERFAGVLLVDVMNGNVTDFEADFADYVNALTEANANANWITDAAGVQAANREKLALVSA